MTRIQSIASPTKLPRLPRAWRGIAALVLSLMFVPVALADQSAPATTTPAASAAPAAAAPVAP
ncbi:TonB system transport protein ExbB, partial [Pseudomonas syringae pv. actinidiae ICMP 18883]